MFADAVSTLLESMGDRILRIKGLLNVVGDHKPRVIQCVQHVMYPFARIDDWPAQPPYNDQKSRLVFIVRDVPQSMIEKAFEMSSLSHIPPAAMIGISSSFSFR